MTVSGLHWLTWQVAHWGLNSMANILQTTFPNTFLLGIRAVGWFKFHYSILVQVMAWHRTTSLGKWRLIFTMPYDAIRSQQYNNSNKSQRGTALIARFMGPTSLWGRQDPGGPHIGLVSLAIWVGTSMSQCCCRKWNTKKLNIHQHSPRLLTINFVNVGDVMTIQTA